MGRFLETLKVMQFTKESTSKYCIHDHHNHLIHKVPPLSLCYFNPNAEYHISIAPHV